MVKYCHEYKPHQGEEPLWRSIEDAMVEEEEAEDEEEEAEDEVEMSRPERRRRMSCTDF